MTDTPRMVSEVEAVKRERAAWASGRYLATDFPIPRMHELPLPRMSYKDCEREANARYPLPKVTRPRVVKDPHGAGYFWTTAPRTDCRPGLRISHSGHDSDLPFIPGVHPTPERVKLWADLLANPTEEADPE